MRRTYVEITTGRGFYSLESLDTIRDRLDAARESSLLRDGPNQLPLLVQIDQYWEEQDETTRTVLNPAAVVSLTEVPDSVTG